MYKFVVLSVLLGLSTAYRLSSDDHSIELPVKSTHEMEEIPVQSEEEEHTTNVEINGGVLPVYLSFKSQSSPLYVKQEHKGTKGSYQKTDSKDEPHRLVHEVTKPVYQELKEIITPFRKVIQVIEPVSEDRMTKVHKGERKGGNGGDDEGKGYEGEKKSRNGSDDKGYEGEKKSRYGSDDNSDEKERYEDNDDQQKKKGNDKNEGKYIKISDLYNRVALKYKD